MFISASSSPSFSCFRTSQSKTAPGGDADNGTKAGAEGLRELIAGFRELLGGERNESRVFPGKKGE